MIAIPMRGGAQADQVLDIVPRSKSKHFALQGGANGVACTFCALILSITGIIWHNQAAMIQLRRAEREGV